MGLGASRSSVEDALQELDQMVAKSTLEKKQKHEAVIVYKLLKQNYLDALRRYEEVTVPFNGKTEEERAVSLSQPDVVLRMKITGHLVEESQKSLFKFKAAYKTKYNDNLEAF